MRKFDNNYIYIAIIASLLFTIGIGSVHLFDWDEINFAECAREMIVSGNYSRPQIAFQPFWEKPPLFIWLQVLSMKAFGMSEFAVRFPNALTGVLALLLLYRIGKQSFDSKTGLIWCLMYAGSYLSFFYFKSGIIDPLFNLLMFLSLYFLSTNITRNIIIAGILTGLAVMTKGPVAWIVVGASWFLFLLIDRLINKRQLLLLLLWLMASVGITSLWFGYETYMHGIWFVKTFIEYQIRLLTIPDAGHKGFLFYHWIILTVGMLPASVYFIAYILRGKYKSWSDLEKLLFISFWLVLVLFTLVKTKIVHYSSFCYYPLTLLAARYISVQLQNQRAVNRTFNIASAALMLVTAMVALFIFLASHPRLLIPYINDTFAIANLEANVIWPHALYLIPGFIFLILLLLVLFNKFHYRVYIQAGINTLFMNLLMLLIVPRVEAIIQASYINMCKQYAKEGALLLPYGFKSYAHLFYGNLSPEQCRYTSDDLLNVNGANTDRKKYLICKKGKENELLAMPGVHLIKSENGYLLFEIIHD